MGDVDGPRRDRRPQRRPSNASNAVWSLTLCFIRVSDHLFVSRPPTRAKLAPYGLRRGLCVFDLYCLNVTTCHCPGIAILRSAPYCRPWVVGLGGGGSALVPLNTRRTCTSPSRGTSCIPNRYAVPGRYTYVPTMGDVDGPRRDRRPQRRPSNASNAVWSLTLCFIRVSDHLFVVGSH